MDTVDVVSPSHVATIRDLNDAFRVSFVGGTVCVTGGIRALDQNLVARILKMVRDFKEFDDGNDPHGEHDLGTFEASAQKVMWKIDYYDRAVKGHSPNPADPRVTARILTIMLAEEY
jgi:hypothetical protein